MSNGNKLYYICTRIPVCHLADYVYFGGFSNNNLVYTKFWDNIAILEYDTDAKYYTLKEFGYTGNSYSYAGFGTEAALFQYMDQNGIEFIGENNPMGVLFYSYAAAFLEIIRWSAEVAYSKKFQQQLLEG